MPPPQGAVRITKGTRLLFLTRNVHADHIVGVRAQGVYDDGSDFSFYGESAVLATDRSLETWYSNETALKDGWITQLYAGSFAAVVAVKRGETWVEVYTSQGKDPSQTRAYLTRGYVTSSQNIVLGEIQIPGPGGGEGFLSITTLATDVAGDVDTTVTLAATNALRKVHNIVIYYNASGDAASRVVQPIFQQPLGALPTGFATVANADVWDSTAAAPTLTANQEGTVYLFPEGVTVNTNGTVSYVNTTTARHPLPLLITEGDPMLFIIDIASGHANDRYSAYALVEEWLVP